MATLFIGCLAGKSFFIQDQANYIAVKDYIHNNIGPIEQIWPIVDGWITPLSYQLEFAEPSTTEIWILEGNYTKADLVAAKKKTVAIEAKIRQPLKSRIVNLNPGLVDQDSMILASHKFSDGRFLLKDNVWAEQQFAAKNGVLTPLPNAFQEYIMGDRLERMQKLARRSVTESI